MDEETTQTPVPTPAPPAAIPSHWQDFDGVPVLVQLRTPVMLCTYPNLPVEQDQEIATTNYLRGVCSVRGPDIGKNVTIVTQDPYRGGLVVTTLVPVDEIRYISRVDAR